MSKYHQPPEHAVHIMLDLETMGTDPYSPITAIGACRFEMHDDMKAMEPFYQPVLLESNIELGLRPSAATILWWMQQSKDAQSHLVDERACALPLALDAFTDWLGDRPDLIWGNSARFDVGLLEAAYKACGKLVPWKFYNEKCYRTVKGLPGADAVKLVRKGMHHNALDDAISQALHLRAIYKKLGMAEPAVAPRLQTVEELVPDTPLCGDFATGQESDVL